jgi:hypothetical protein
MVPFGAGDRGTGEGADTRGNAVWVDLPQAHGFAMAGGGQGVTVRTERQSVDRGRMASENRQLAGVLEISDVPQPDSHVGTGGGQDLAVRPERHTVDTRPVAEGSQHGEVVAVVTSHSLAVRSELAVARILPSGLNATERTASRWPRRTANSPRLSESVTFHK